VAGAVVSHVHTDPDSELRAAQPLSEVAAYDAIVAGLGISPVPLREGWRPGDCLYEALIELFRERLRDALGLEPTAEALRERFAGRLSLDFARADTGVAGHPARYAPFFPGTIRRPGVREDDVLAARERVLDFIRTPGGWDDDAGDNTAAALAQAYGLRMVLMGRDGRRRDVGPDGAREGYVLYAGDHYTAAAISAGTAIFPGAETSPAAQPRQPREAPGDPVARRLYDALAVFGGQVDVYLDRNRAGVSVQQVRERLAAVLAEATAGPQREWQRLDRDRGLAFPADPELTGGVRTAREDWVAARPGAGRGYAVHLPTGMIALPGEPGDSPAHTVHGVSYGWTRRGSDLVHRTSGAVLRGPGAAIGWADPARLADPGLGAIGHNQLNRDDLLTWLLEQGALEGPLPWLAQGPGWQQLTDVHGATWWVWNSPGPVRVLPPELNHRTASGAGMRCLLDSLRQLMQPLLPDGQRDGMSVDFLLDWLVEHLPLNREAREARAQLLTEQMVDVWGVLPVFTSMFQVRVQVFRHATQAGQHEWQGYPTIQPSPLEGPSVDHDGNPTPDLAPVLARCPLRAGVPHGR